MRALFFLSGISGLIYESIWSRYTRQFVGSAATAQILVLSLFISKWSNGANSSDNHPGPVLTDGGKEDGNIAKPGDSTVGA